MSLKRWKVWTLERADEDGDASSDLTPADVYAELGENENRSYKMMVRLPRPIRNHDARACLLLLARGRLGPIIMQPS